MPLLDEMLAAEDRIPELANYQCAISCIFAAPSGRLIIRFVPLLRREPFATARAKHLLEIDPPNLLRFDHSAALRANRSVCNTEHTLGHRGNSVGPVVPGGALWPTH